MQTPLDRIESDIILPVPIERAWAAVTRVEEISRWFPKNMEMDFRTGGEFTMYFESGDTARGVIEAIDPPHRFAYIWEAKGADPNLPVKETYHTLVTYHLETVPEGTRLIVVETGFAELPEHQRQAILEGNVHGWAYELAELLDYLSGAK